MHLQTSFSFISQLSPYKHFKPHIPLKYTHRSQSSVDLMLFSFKLSFMACPPILQHTKSVYARLHQSDLFSYVSPPISIINYLNFDFCNNAFSNKFLSNPIPYLPTDYHLNNHIPSYKQIRLYLSLLLPLLRSSVSRAFLSFLPYIYFLCGCCALCNNRHYILYIA